MTGKSTSVERSVIGCMIMDEKLCENGLIELSNEDFTDPDCKRIFAGMLFLHKAKSAVDLSTVCGLFEAEYALTITDIAALDYQQANFDSYVKTLKRETKNRKFVSGLTKILESAKSGEDGCLADTQMLLNELTGLEDAGVKPLSDFIPDAVMNIGNPQKGIPTGFSDLDALTKGLVKGNLIVVAGRPGMGKSAFAANVATNVARAGKTVVYFSLEMTGTEIVQRIIYGESSQSEDELFRAANESDTAQINKLWAATDRIGEMKFYLNDTPKVSVRNIYQNCKKVQALEGNLDLIVIDYLGLIQMRKISNNSSKAQEIGEVTHELKRMAKELDTPIILVSQLNRESEGRSDHTPILSDLKDSSEIEADADIVLFPYRPWVYDKDCAPTEAKLVVAKNRNGAVGTVDLYWNGGLFRFNGVFNTDEAQNPWTSRDIG